MVRAQGKIISERYLTVRFRALGPLEDIFVKPGDFVKKGQTLVIIEKTKKELALRKAKASLFEKKIEFDDLVLQYGAGDTLKLNKEIIRSLEAKSGLLNAQILVEEAELELKNASVKAPFDGVIADVYPKKNDLVSLGDPFCIVYDKSLLQAEVSILEDDFSEVDLGYHARVAVLSYPDKYFESVVSEINPKVNESGLITIKLDIVNGIGLLPGMNATVTILVPKSENIIVPKEAVVIRSGRKVVFTEEDGFANWHYVETGLENGEEIEIIQGLMLDQKVIVSNNIQLAHDTPVKVVLPN